MFNRFGLILLFVLAAMPSLADTPTSLDSAISAASDLKSRPIPKSVWNVDGRGNALHLQSALHCDAEINDYKRINIITYDRFGLDVSCEYLDDNRNLITIYLTRRSGRTLSDDFTEAKRELTAVTPEATPMADEAQKVVPPDLQWLHLIYSEHAGAINSGIWIADLDGWTLEFRATYPADHAPAVLDQMSAMTTGAQNTAGMHLNACAKAAPVVRSAKRIIDKDKLMQLTLMSSITAAATDDSKPSPVEEWCVEQTIDDPQMPMTFWRNINSDGHTGPVDRVTLMAVGDAPTFVSSADASVSVILGKLGARSDAICHTVTTTEQDRIFFYAYFDGRPDADSLVGVARDVLTHKAGILSGYDKTKKAITIVTPDAK
jgi:hypothetical protein